MLLDNGLSWVNSFIVCCKVKDMFDKDIKCPNTYGKYSMIFEPQHQSICIQLCILAFTFPCFSYTHVLNFVPRKVLTGDGLLTQEWISVEQGCWGGFFSGAKLTLCFEVESIISGIKHFPIK